MPLVIRSEAFDFSSYHYTQLQYKTPSAKVVLFAEGVPVYGG